MGYFSNGTEGMFYQEEYCNRCLHENQEKEIYCPIWNRHLLDNSKECNNDSSYLHDFIPLEGITNKRCTMFVDRGLLSNLQIEQWEYEQTKDRTP